MCQHVSLEVTICCAFVFTLIAAERLLSGMNKNMNFQMSSCCEREGAHWASVGFLSSLLYFGLGGETHYSKFNEKLVATFRQLVLLTEISCVCLVSKLWIDWKKNS